MDFFNTWLALPLASQITTVVIVSLGIVFIAAAISVFIKIFHLRIGTDGITRSDEQEKNKTEINVNIGDKKEEEKKEEKPCIDPERPSLLTHHLFIELLGAMHGSYDLPLTSNKNAVANTFLRDCKLKVWYEMLHVFYREVENNQGANLDGILNKLYEIIDTYSILARDISVQLPDGKTLKGIPSIYIEKFSSWHQPHVEICVKGLKEVINGRFYNDWWTKSIVTLEILSLAFDLTFKDSELTLETLNGELDKAIARQLSIDE